MRKTLTSVRSRWIAAAAVVGVAAIVSVSLSLHGGSPAPAAPVAAPKPVTDAPPPIVFDEASSKISAQDEYSTTRVDSHGVHQVLLNAEPVSVKVGDAWVPASAALTPDAAGGLAAQTHPLSLKLASKADDPALVAVKRDGYSVTFALQGAAPSPVTHVEGKLPAIDADGAVYKNVFDGADLAYDVSPSSLKESIVLQAPPTTDSLSYTWTVNAPGLDVSKNEHGELVFVAPDGTVEYSMPLPVMVDSSGVTGQSEPAAVNIPYEIAKVSDGVYQVTVSPDVKWLKDPARVYPVAVDPTIQPGPFLMREYKQDGVVFAQDIRVGNVHTSSSCCNWRSVAAYDYSGLMSKQITDAHLYTSYLAGTVNCYGGGVYNATGWSYGSVGAYLSYFPNCRTGDAGDAIYQQIADWVRGANPYGALVFTGYEAPVYSYKVLSTSLAIYYVDAPTVTGMTGLTPQNGVKADAMPVMEPIGSISAGSNQYFQYIFTSDNGGTPWTSPWEVGGPYRLPDGALTSGKHYTYSIKTKDDYPVSPEPVISNGAWNFTTDAPPNAPTAITVQGQPLTANVTSSVERPTLAATVSDPGGGDVWAVFTVMRDGIVVMDSVAGNPVHVTAAGSGVSSATLPYAITESGHYTVEVRAFDGHLASGVTASDPYWFTGPPRSIREIPGNNDGDTGSTS